MDSSTASQTKRPSHVLIPYPHTRTLLGVSCRDSVNTVTGDCRAARSLGGPTGTLPVAFKIYKSQLPIIGGYM